jgi:hypothetical protein
MEDPDYYEYKLLPVRYAKACSAVEYGVMTTRINAIAHGVYRWPRCLHHQGLYCVLDPAADGSFKPAALLYVLQTGSSGNKNKNSFFIGHHWANRESL